MENNKYALNIYPRAQADLEDIFQYISEELCNPSAAVAYHVFRHTFTCWLCENASKGSPIETVKYIQSILGHADASVTLNIYAACREKKRTENHELLKRIAEAD
ncbi:MAG: hypothetical protein LUH20_05235 [Lachnospiraceae bacterium]|nr:hypothetical protein [Lachnospiraceae bacterium]